MDDFLFNGFPIVFAFIMLTILTIFCAKVISVVKEKAVNQKSPLLTTPAEVVSKRSDVRGNNSYTTYFVTFEVPSGDRMELRLSGKEYGLIGEQDIGMLSFQGTKYVSFERMKETAS